MKYMELIAPCHFGMEAVLKREILDLGYEISKVEDGKVTFLADAEGIAQESLKRSHLMNFLKKQKQSRGKNIFRKTVNSGWQRQTP